MGDPRFTVCRGIYESGSRFFPLGSPARLAFIGTMSGTGARIVQSGFLVCSRSDADLHCRGFTPEVQGATGGRGDLEKSLLFPVSTETPSFNWTVGGSTYEVTFDLSCGGMITSWAKNGTELLAASDGRLKGIQSQLSWTSLSRGTFERHNVVQGGDLYSANPLNKRGGLLFAWSPPTLSHDGSRVATASFYPILQDPDGQQSVPFVSSWHGGGEDMPVYALSFPTTVSYTFNAFGEENLHRVSVALESPSEDVTGHFDMSLAVNVCASQTAFSRVVAYDGTQTDITPASSFERQMLDRSSRRIDNDATVYASPVSGSAFVSAAGALDSEQAFAVGNRETPEPAGDRVLGDTARGNAWSTMSNTGALETFHGIGYGHHLSSRIHPDTELRTLPKGVVEADAYLATGTNTENQSLLSLL